LWHLEQWGECGKKRGQVRIRERKEPGRFRHLADERMPLLTLTDFFGATRTFGLGEPCALLHQSGFGFGFLLG
jgi:hypothetical protein